MKKSYEQFKINDVEEIFGLEITSSDNCVVTSDIKPYQLDKLFVDDLNEKAILAFSIDTEKARSELIVSNVLFELRKVLEKKISFFSGISFNIQADKGLKGRCDFLVSLNEEQLILKAPVIALVEAKNDNIIGGLGQCIAEMIASQIFNQRKGIEIPTIYGIVTTGSNWRFLKLTDKKVCIERNEIHLDSIELIFGILIDIIRRNQKYVKEN
jgi:hypothetical protein